jgi:haloalkane dehalogenase
MTPSWLDRRAYPFASRTLPLRAGRMHYVDEGQGEPLLFVHGTPTWSFEYRHLVSVLSRRFRCIAPDHLGFGLSERPAAIAYTPEAHAANLDEFVDRLGLTRFTLIVHDFGGPIAFPLALREHSAVSRLVIMNTWCWPFADHPAMVCKAQIAGGPLGRLLYRYANASLRLIMPSAYGDKRKLTPEIHRQYLSVFEDRDARVRVLHALARALLASNGFYADLWREAERLRRVPSLIVWGLKDSAFPPAFLDRWRTLLPDARVAVLERAGHWPHEEDPHSVIAEIEAFLTDHADFADPAAFGRITTSTKNTTSTKA